MTNKAERLAQEMTYLNHHRQFNLQDLIIEFNISKRTALRDLSELEKLGLAFYSTPGKYGGYQVVNRDPLIPVTFTTSEIAAIFFAINALQVLNDNPFRQSYPRIAKRLMATLPEKQRRLVNQQQAVVKYYNVPVIHQNLSLSKLLTVIINCQQVQFASVQLGTTIHAQLLALLYRSGNWFVEGMNLLDHSWLRLRCDLLSDFRVEKTPAPYSLSQLVKLSRERKDTESRTAFVCRITTQGKEHFLKNNYPHMQIVGDRLEGSYTKWEAQYIVDYLLSFGSQMLVVSPASLREKYKERLSWMLNQY